MSWDKYFLDLTVKVSSRSKDPHTKCGCILVNSQNEVISCGFNGPVRNCDDSLIPNSRPEKYSYYIHSEINAVLSAKTSLVACKAYVSGRPCLYCTQILYHVGIRDIIYTDYSKPSSVHYPEKEFNIFLSAIEEPLNIIYIPGNY